MLDLDSTANYAEKPTENSTTSQDSERPPHLRDLPKGLALSAVARLVLAALICDYANGKPETWPEWIQYLMAGRKGYVAWPKVATLCDATGLSERSVQKGLRELEAIGAIQFIHRSKGGGSHKPVNSISQSKPNCYLITPHLVHRGFASSTPQEMHPDTEHGAHHDTSTVHMVLEHGAPHAPDCSITTDLENTDLEEREVYTQAASSTEKPSDDDVAAHKKPPEKATQESAGLREYLERIATALKARACVRSLFRKGDRQLAAQAFHDGVAIEQIERGILLACLRWYYARSNNSSAVNPICSFRYFAGSIAEAGESAPSSYWVGIERKVHQIEKNWPDQRKTPASEPPASEKEGWFDAQIDQLIREQEASSSARADDQRKPPAREPAQPEAVSGFAY